jgi:hypothetical protein
MLRKLLVVAVMMCMVSYASAGTASIGTASARGDLRVDSYLVKGNATLFDGSVVETGQATADLRLEKGTEITMATSSRGTLYRDRLILKQGKSQLAANSSFQLEANGLRVTPSEPNSRGVVSLLPGNTVEVAALNGSLGVTNSQGVLLANVRPGHALSFAIQADAGANSFSGVGLLSSENGRYYITLSDTGITYEITGKDLKKFVGQKVVVTGTTQATGTTMVISANSVRTNGDNGFSTRKSLLILGAILVPAAGIGLAVHNSTQSSTPASR